MSPSTIGRWLKAGLADDVNLTHETKNLIAQLTEDKKPWSSLLGDINDLGKNKPEAFKSKSSLARELEVSSTTIAYWLKAGLATDPDLAPETQALLSKWAPKLCDPEIWKN